MSDQLKQDPSHSIMATRVWNGTRWHYPVLERVLADRDARIAKLEAANAVLRAEVKLARIHDKVHRRVTLDGYDMHGSLASSAEALSIARAATDDAIKVAQEGEGREVSDGMTIEMFRKIKNCVPFATPEAGATETMDAMDWADARIVDLERQLAEAVRAVEALIVAAHNMTARVYSTRDNWAESSPEKQNELWRAMHEANAELDAAIERARNPSTRTVVEDAINQSKNPDGKW